MIDAGFCPLGFSDVVFAYATPSICEKLTWTSDLKPLNYLNRLKYFIFIPIDVNKHMNVSIFNFLRCRLHFIVFYVTLQAQVRAGPTKHGDTVAQELEKIIVGIAQILDQVIDAGNKIFALFEGDGIDTIQTDTIKILTDILQQAEKALNDDISGQTGNYSEFGWLVWFKSTFNYIISTLNLYRVLKKG